MSAILISDNFHVLSPELVSSAAPAQLDLRTAVLSAQFLSQKQSQFKFKKSCSYLKTPVLHRLDTYVLLHIVPLHCSIFKR